MQSVCYNFNMVNDYVIKLRDGRELGYAEYGDPKGKPIFYEKFDANDSTLCA